MTEKADELEKLVPSEEVMMSDEYQNATLKAKRQKMKDENAVWLWKDAVREFQDAEKQNEISESERDNALNHLKEYLEQEIAS